jgi:hypothetical protein
LLPQDAPRLSTDPTHHILQRHLVSCRIRDPINHYDLLLGQKKVVAPTYRLDVSTGPTKHFPSHQSLQLLQIFGYEQYTTKFGLCSQLFHKNQHEAKEHPSQKVQLNKQLLKVSETGKISHCSWTKKNGRHQYLNHKSKRGLKIFDRPQVRGRKIE